MLPDGCCPDCQHGVVGAEATMPLRAHVVPPSGRLRTRRLPPQPDPARPPRRRPAGSATTAVARLAPAGGGSARTELDQPATAARPGTGDLIGPVGYDALN